MMLDAHLRASQEIHIWEMSLLGLDRVTFLQDEDMQ